MKWTKIEVRTGSRTEFIDITNRISEELARAGVQNGICSVYMPHTTAGLTINENADPDVVRDILAGLARLVAAAGDFRHAEGNSDAHIKASLMGFSLTVPVIDGCLALGTWQSLYFCEFDGPRNRQVLVGISEQAG
ncbi:MAG: secondary thiamine-phosphate synthase enzyme YjbQ [Methanospirillum sp.]|nr:secondary thiamine-phosphate synthase enzyme YjbQ [Methanospirillum sp.]